MSIDEQTNKGSIGLESLDPNMFPFDSWQFTEPSTASPYMQLNDYDLKVANDLYVTGNYYGDLFDLLTASSDTTISDSGLNIHYAATAGANGFTFVLPTLADNQGRILKFTKVDSGYGPVVIDGEGDETINDWDQIILKRKNESVAVLAISTCWLVINEWKWYVETGQISTSDWTNRHIGTIDLNYNNLSGTFQQWEPITEETSGYRGIVAADTGSILRLWYIDDGAGGVGGFFTNGREITGEISGATADVNGNTKNVDSNIYHGLGINLRQINQKAFWSSDGTENLVIEITNHIVRTDGGEDSGTNNFQIDTTSTKIQTGNSGVRVRQDAGGSLVLNTQDDYYSIGVEVI